VNTISRFPDESPAVTIEIYVSENTPGNFFIEEAKVGVHDGAWFGNKDYVRINFGCPSSVLEEALLRIKKAFSQRN